MVAEASYGQKFLFPVLCWLLSSVLWCHLLLSKKNLDGRSGEGVWLAELCCIQKNLKRKWRCCKIAMQLMLLGSIREQTVVMKLLNYGDRFVWGGWGSDAVVQAPGVGCVPRAWGMLRRGNRDGNRGAEGGVSAAGMDAMQRGANGWTGMLEKGKLFLLSCWRAAIAQALNHHCVLGTLCWMPKPSWDSPILAVHGCAPFSTVKQLYRAWKQMSSQVLCFSDLSLEKGILMSVPRGKRLKPGGCIYSLWCSAASLTPALWQNPFVTQDGTGVEIKAWGFY